MPVTAHMVAVTMLLVAQPSSDTTPRTGVAPIRHAVITVKDSVKLPAMQAGVLESLRLDNGQIVEEGVEVTKNQLLGKLDDRDAATRKRAAELEYQVAQSEQTKSVVEISRTGKQTEYYRAELAASESVNERSPGAISGAELRRFRVQVDLGEAGEKVARADAVTAELTIDLRMAQIDVATVNLDRHQIKSPIDGEVVQVFYEVGEWVSPGDPILRIVDFGRLRVEGFLKIDEYLRQDVIGQPVEIEVRMPHGIERFQSSISYASPLVQASGDFRVVCEVENRKADGQWVLLPGMDAEMNIELKRNRVAAK